MNESDEKIRNTIIKLAVEDWLDHDNPFSDIIFKQGLLGAVMEELDEEDGDENDVEFVWKLLTEEGYFRKRGKSRRITAKEIDEAERLGVTTPIDSEVQQEILQVLKEVEREDVNRPEISREDLLDRLEFSEEEIDYNLFYCRSKSWAEVGVYISDQPWEHAEITRYGRSVEF